MKSCTILGAGLVGSLLSIYMAKRGYQVNVFEKRPDLRKAGNYGGRSINLALSDRGFEALKKIGIVDDVKSVGIPMYGRMLHAVDGTLTYQPYGKEGQAIYSVSRSGLNFKLLDLAEQFPNVTLNFNEGCEGADLRNQIVHLKNTLTSESTHIENELVFGTDGAFSALRLSMQFSHRFDYAQDYLPQGYKELTIPALADGGFAMDVNSLHIWPRGAYMMIALPNPDGSFTCTLFFPFEGKDSFESINSDEEILEFFNRVFPDAVPLMPTLLEDYKNNPTSALVTVKCFPWVNGNMVLLGDAAHAIVPFYGQGMNCGFEDVRVLDDLIDHFGDGDLAEVLNQFQTLRKPDGDAIADLAKANFIEMRDKVADPQWQLQKKIESHFYNKYPEKWIPLYSMVTFSPHIRYSDALKNGQKQDQIMQEVLNTPDIEAKWNSPEIEMLMLELIEKHGSI